MSSSELLLIDLSYIAHSLFHANGVEAAPEHVAKQMVVKVQQLAANHPHAAVCCDSGRSFRRELDPTYKAQRETEHRAAVQHQIELACAALKADGFPVWSVDGFEADDLIATATARALAIDETRVLIASSDKDLLQLVSDRVTVQSLRDDKGALTTNGRQMTADAVREKFGVSPGQMVDWLCLVGDASDNIKGADGIGAKTATELLAKHGSLDAIYEAMTRGVVAGLSPTKRKALVELRDRVRADDGAMSVISFFEDIPETWRRVGLEHVRNLIRLRSDVPIPFEEISAERGTNQMADSDKSLFDVQTADLMDADSRRELTEAQAVDAAMAGAQKAADRIATIERGNTQPMPTLPMVRREQPPPLDATIVQSVLLQGDLSRLNPTQRIAYYNRVCESLGLNPMTQPFAYLRLNGKEVLYAKKDAAEQLRFIHGISIDPRGFTREVIEGVYVVTAPASMPNGRTDVSTGAVAIDGLKGEARSNAMMKAETKAKRRVTLSICGLGMLDETEVETVEAR